MSQIIFKTPDGGTVLTGWDRPLQYFFITVYGPPVWDSPPDGNVEEPIVFSSLDDPKSRMGGYDSVLPILEVLNNLGIPTPRDLIQILTYHRQSNQGNTIVRL